jgi:NADH-ubiquinone oxidoreductase chain 6|uniref:NADH-ubiquinone oxidoreductase chain 6 n=1 Tax=Thecamonas trahens TaxID=529818 RepID=A0A0B5H2Q7_THETB|nr:NADH dehydrogenase subunit 6 [Thecamonas trahens]AJF36633.1 NADH dehydrogenase subunit 6 [Thecamonas trahens]
MTTIGDFLITNLFYFFSFLMLLSSIMVIGAKNPIHSVLFLILVFCNATGLLILLEVEFLAMIFLVVYVGAIAVLFLFVVMMLNIKIIELSENLFLYLPVGAFIALIFLFEIFLVIDTDLMPVFTKTTGDIINFVDWTNKVTYTSNIAQLGNIMYTYYFYLFLVASMILLVAMIGAIMLTLHRNKKVRRQEIYKQISRDFNKTVVVKYTN